MMKKKNVWSQLLLIIESLADLCLDILNLDTPIVIIDSAKTAPKPSQHKKSPSNDFPLKIFPDSLFESLHNAHRVDYSFLNKSYQHEGQDDPLSDEYLDSLHRKPERQERGIRNADKGRAQHEKDQVIRLLEGLQGPDWLKLMGVSGITDSKKKDYEPARAYFLKGCETIIVKFRRWREEEKRRRLEKEAALAEAEAEEVVEDEEAEEEEEQEDLSDGDPPDYSDTDASAARQLHEEAIARTAALASKHSERRDRVGNIAKPVHEFEKEFKSFFTKSHIREAALGKHRRSGRSVAAWGQPVPDVPEVDFDLPEEYRDDDTLKSHARRKMASRRVNKD